MRDEGDDIVCGFTPPSLSPEPDPADSALIRFLRAGELATCWDFRDVIVGGGEYYVPGPDVREPLPLPEPFSPINTYILLGLDNWDMNPTLGLASAVIVEILDDFELGALVGHMIVANLYPEQFEKPGPWAGVLRFGNERGRYDMEITGSGRLARNIGAGQVFGTVVAFP